MAGIETAEDLYGLPLERFIPERAALAKALRTDKRRDEAAEVAARRKPSVAAWAVNQLVRTQGKTIATLFEAGDDLADAQAGAAEGRKTAEQMRGAMRRQRDAIDSLVEAAKGLLSQDGHPLSPQTLERVTDTLRAASIDPGSREQVQSGCLTQELRFAGLGLGGDLGGALAASLPAAPPARRDTKPKKASAPKAKTRAAAAKETEAAEAEAAAEKERKENLREARRAEREARRAATRAEKELQAAEHRRDEARSALEDAEQRLTEATETYQRASGELAEAEAQVAELDG